MNKFRIFIAIGAVFLIAGCTGISKGITQAILEQEDEDTRACEIVGSAFPGVAESLGKQAMRGPNHTTKILMVHGISKHIPGYSAPFRIKLAHKLGLSAMEKEYKEIKLQSPHFRNENGIYDELGTLRVYRHKSPSTNQEMLFYELTWSPITEPSKEMIEFDDSVEHTHKRAQINASMKSFMNKTVPDLLIYLGTKKDHINTSVSQSICWMFSGDWNALPEKGTSYCNPARHNSPEIIRDDDFFFVTHSLGSRITIDTANFFSVNFSQDDDYSPKMIKEVNEAIRDKNFTVFMLANQLPLLEMARTPPEVTGQIEDYCLPNSEHYDERIMGKLQIVAFSDPNDILSYPVPVGFENDYIDSRLCPDIMNVSLNVAGVKDVLGAAEFADPLEAHLGYQEDDRVIGIITEGVQRNDQAAIVSERCEWTEITD